MKCPNCNGTGEITVPVTEHMGTVLYGTEQCDECNGTGEYEPFDADVELDKLYPTELTNEEHIKSLDTEQLAEWISSVVQKAISIKESNSIVMLESAIWWDEWLKQPHTTKE